MGDGHEKPRLEGNERNEVGASTCEKYEQGMIRPQQPDQRGEQAAADGADRSSDAYYGGDGI
jgi:hypothetical protein